MSNQCIRKRRRNRVDEKFHKYIQKITTSSVFNGFIMVVIVLNSLAIGFETVEEWKVAYKNVFKALDELFLAIYTMEFLMKLYAEPRGYWKSSYNRFDFSILALSYVQVIMDELNVGDKILTPLRLLRAARTLRTISFIEGLQVLVTALIDTIRNSVLNVVILLAMLMAFFAVVGYYIFGYEEETGDKENWGTLSTAMLTLFTFVTVDGWTEIQKDLDKRPYSQWFTVIFIFLGHFIFTNLFIGIIIMNIHEATEKFIAQQRQEHEAVLQMKKDFLFQRQRDDVKEMLEKQVFDRQITSKLVSEKLGEAEESSNLYHDLEVAKLNTCYLTVLTVNKERTKIIHQLCRNFSFKLILHVRSRYMN